MTKRLVYPAWLPSVPSVQSRTHIYSSQHCTHSHAEHTSAHTQYPPTHAPTHAHSVYGPEISNIQVLPLLLLPVNCWTFCDNSSEAISKSVSQQQVRHSGAQPWTAWVTLELPEKNNNHRLLQRSTVLLSVFTNRKAVFNLQILKKISVTVDAKLVFTYNCGVFFGQMCCYISIYSIYK